MFSILLSFFLFGGDNPNGPDMKSRIRAACGGDENFEWVNYVKEEHTGTTYISGVGSFPLHLKLTYSVSIPLVLLETMRDGEVKSRSGFNGSSFWKDAPKQKVPLPFEIPILDLRKNSLLVILTQPTWVYQTSRETTLNDKHYKVAVFSHREDGDIVNLLLDPASYRICGFLDPGSQDSYTIFEAFASFKGILLPTKTKSFHKGERLAVMEISYDLLPELPLQIFENTSNDER